MSDDLSPRHLIRLSFILSYYAHYSVHEKMRVEQGRNIMFGLEADDPLSNTKA